MCLWGWDGYKMVGGSPCVNRSNYTARIAWTRAEEALILNRLKRAEQINRGKFVCAWARRRSLQKCGEAGAIGGVCVDNGPTSFFLRLGKMDGLPSKSEATDGSSLCRPRSKQAILESAKQRAWMMPQSPCLVGSRESRVHGPCRKMSGAISRRSYSRAGSDVAFALYHGPRLGATHPQHRLTICM